MTCASASAPCFSFPLNWSQNHGSSSTTGVVCVRLNVAIFRSLVPPIPRLPLIGSESPKVVAVACLEVVTHLTRHQPPQAVPRWAVSIPLATESFAHARCYIIVPPSYIVVCTSDHKRRSLYPHGAGNCRSYELPAMPLCKMGVACFAPAASWFSAPRLHIL